MSTWSTIYGGEVDGDPVRASPDPFDAEASGASITASDIQTVSVEFSRIRYGSSEGFRGATAEALGRKVNEWQAHLDPAEQVFRDVSHILSAHAEGLTALRSEANVAAAKALAVWKLKNLAAEREASGANSLDAATGQVTAASRQLRLIEAQIIALVPGTPDGDILLPRLKIEKSNWSHELTTRTQKVNSIGAEVRTAKADVATHESSLRDWFSGSRTDSWRSLRHREDALNQRTAKHVNDLSLRDVEDPGWLNEQLANFGEFVRDAAETIRHVAADAIKNLIKAIKVALVVVLIILAVVVAVVAIAALIYVLVAFASIAVAALAAVARVVITLAIRALASAVVRALARLALRVAVRYALRQVSGAFADFAAHRAGDLRKLLGEPPPVIDHDPAEGTQSGRLQDLIREDPAAVDTYKAAYKYEGFADDVGHQENTAKADTYTASDGTVWTVPSLDDLSAAGIPSSLLRSWTGLHATVYLRPIPDGHGQGHEYEVVVAFGSTELKTPLDIAQDGLYADLGDAVGGNALNVLPNQQRQATELASLVAKSYGTDNIVFTGHSLGGDLAAQAAMESGASAVTWNAKGTNLQDLYGDQWPDQQRIASAAHQRILAYSTSNDGLTGVQEGSILPDSIGTRVVVPTERPESPLAGHMLDAFPTSLDQPGWLLEAPTPAEVRS
jgi:hypothetical protein